MAAKLSRLERITNLVLVLLDTTRPIPLREIGTAVAGYPAQPGALRQAFERDKRTLREGGIPVAAERVEGEDQVGYRIYPDEYYLVDLGLTPEEEEALSFALALVRVEGGLGRDIAAKFGGNTRSNLAPVVVLPTLEGLGVLHEAISRRSTVMFSYRGRARELHGYGLLFSRGSWYFVAFEVESGTVKTFRVDRIEDTPTLGVADAYEVPADLDLKKELRAPFLSSGEQDEGTGATEVVLEVDAREARAVVGLVGDRFVEERFDDGSMRLRFFVGDESALVRYVVGLADTVELVAPERLRAQVVETLDAYVSEHRDAAPISRART